MEPRWYVCEARPREEQVAREQIFGRGFEVIFPTFLQRRKVRGGGRQWVEASAFGPYLFVRFDQERDAWGSILAARGVRRLFCADGERPVPLPEAVGRDLVERFSSTPLPDIDAVLEAMEIGMRVSILDGRFAGHVGICRRSTQARVSVLLSIFGAKWEVDLDARSVLVLS
jgi:transcription antitermination factor NusG